LKETIAMNVNGKHLSRWTLLTTGFAAMAVTACHSVPSSARAQGQTQGTAQATAQNHANLAIDLDCMRARFSNPTEAFHYSYDWDGNSGFVKLEADVTPNSIDGVLNTEFGGGQNLPLTVHAVRSDSDGWGHALGNLNAAFGMPSSMMEANTMPASFEREANGQVNGYDTIRYSLDTARLDAADRALLGSSEKGSLWVSASGCPVRWSIVTEQKNKDGSVDRTRYEGNVTKK
jgi:hypothetical protein